MKVTVRAGLIIAALVLGGCGDSPHNRTEEFLGFWSYTSGTFSVAYPGSQPGQSAVVGSVTITRGPTSDLMYSATANGDLCALPFDVRGSVASVRPGSSCTLQLTDPADGTPYDLTLSPTLWTLSLNPNTRTIAEDAQGNCLEVEPAGSVACTFSQTADLAYTVR